MLRCRQSAIDPLGPTNGCEMIGPSCAIPIAAIERDRAAMSSTFGGEMLHQSARRSRVLLADRDQSIRIGESKWPEHDAIDDSKIVVVRPIPSASVRIAVMLSVRCADGLRSAWRTSARMFRIFRTPPSRSRPAPQRRQRWS